MSEPIELEDLRHLVQLLLAKGECPHCIAMTFTEELWLQAMYNNETWHQQPCHYQGIDPKLN